MNYDPAGSYDFFGVEALAGGSKGVSIKPQWGDRILSFSGAPPRTPHAAPWMLAVAEKYLMFQPRRVKVRNPFMWFARR